MKTKYNIRDLAPDPASINNMVKTVKDRIDILATPEIFNKIFSLIDLTTLNTTDTEERVAQLCSRVNSIEEKVSGIPNVAAICVYPNFVKLVRQKLLIKNVGIVSVAAGFPSSQTFLDIKLKEVGMAVDRGATEIDTVMPLGLFLAGDTHAVSEEIENIKKITGKVTLKIILETGAIPDYEMVMKAAFVCMEAGADFIKTSTGKLSPAATPEAFLVMALAIKTYFETTGIKIGIKPAGGIVTPEDALLYYGIVNEVLGDDWLNKGLFRIGASRLANNLLDKILGTSEHMIERNYF
jgi:deoxyribose-phosphate aldolase